jgi:hypothetical protein
MAAQQAQLAFQQSQTAALTAQAQESQARAQKYLVDAQIAPQELEIDKIEAITRNLKDGDQDDKEFERRLKVAQTLLKEKEVNAKNAYAQSNAAANQQPSNQPQRANQAGQQPGIPSNIFGGNGQ